MYRSANVRREEHLSQHPLSNPKKMREFLSQQRYWVDANLSKVRLADMDQDYLLATMLWLIDRAAKVKFTYEMYYEIKKPEAEKLQELRQLSSETFIRQTPLFEAMKARYLRSSLDDDLVIPTISLDDELNFQDSELDDDGDY